MLHNLAAHHRCSVRQIPQIRQQEFLGTDIFAEREIVVNPNTGVVLRDYERVLIDDDDEDGGWDEDEADDEEEEEEDEEEEEEEDEEEEDDDA